MKPILTRRQKQVLKFINAYRLATQIPPTRAEIAEHFGFASANAAQDHLSALAKKGAVILKGNTARGIFVTGVGLP